MWVSMCSRLQDETARVEDELLQAQPLATLQLAFATATGASFEGILEPYVNVFPLETACSRFSMQQFLEVAPSVLASHHCFSSSNDVQKDC
jgi:hypothetical protein